MTLQIVQAPSSNFNERLHPLDMLVLHYTGMKDGPSALARMRDPETQVSAHYMVEEDGTVFALVPEDKRAWQAGRSWWRWDEDLNSRSIGIEIVNGGHPHGLPPYPDIQIAAVIELCQGILSRWPIPQNRIVAHSDIAPERKEDPGELFPWKRLAEAGVGLWPKLPKGIDRARRTLKLGDDNPSVADMRGKLQAIGYKLDRGSVFDEPAAAVVRAFQRRFRQNAVTGEIDPETAALIDAIAQLYA